ncbi:facilitated trehalose transporter Tret1-like [Leguminivora glycinivorella]|uniref:facilitated trehalose transporter Tret1-like n=1 Tax=Leguminivora glycinivorella TaxID=1035111 RepID=UPI0020108CF6|nr:facilitated trehalose transporter Tret1-like [Leguminivora glycinivorella]
MGKAQQTLTAVAASFAALLMGSLNVWTSYTFEHFTSPNSTILETPMTEFQASLVGSLPFLGAMIGSTITGALINSYGRKLGAIMLVLPYIFHWVTIFMSSSALPIMVARFIGGIPGGAYVVYAPIYISEIAEPAIRGSLASATATFYVMGAIVSYLNGWFISYRTIILINLALCAVNIVLLSLVVESPMFLLRQNKEQAALKALAHYRDGSTTSKSVLEELSAMRQQLYSPIEMASVRTGPEVEESERDKLNADQVEVVIPPKVPAWKLLFTSRSSRRAFFTVWTILTLQVLMGATAVQVYAGQIFEKAAPGQSSSFCSVLVVLTSFGGCALAMAITDKAGRRALLISSLVLSALCLGALGVQLQLGTPPLLTAGTILVFCFLFNYGAGVIPYVLMAEVFSPEVQSIASMILMESMWFTNFLLIAIFPTILSLVGMHSAYFGFACVALGNACFSYFRVPETKGLSGKDIQALFAK